MLTSLTKPSLNRLDSSFKHRRLFHTVTCAQDKKLPFAAEDGRCLSHAHLPEDSQQGDGEVFSDKADSSFNTKEHHDPRCSDKAHHFGKVQYNNDNVHMLIKYTMLMKSTVLLTKSR